MKLVDGWMWPDGEQHMIEWIADPRNRVMLHGRPAYQGKKQIAALAFCPNFRRRTMLDCGAHIGLWAFNFAPYFKHILAFEPVAAHRECFRENMMGIDNVTLYPYALGERSDKVAIRVNPTSSGDSWVKGKGDVEMRPLDSFTASDVDFIKIDAEGYEEFILKGGEDTIARWKPVIIVEQKRDMATKFGLKPQGAVAFLKEMRYRVAQEIGGDYIMVPV